jgi:vacuolar-type H+-ATPase subunit F/Vma7
MGAVVAIGETHEVQGFALAGVSVIVATTDTEISEAWRHLAPETALAILTARAAAALEPRLTERPDVLTVVMP